MFDCLIDANDGFKIRINWRFLFMEWKLLEAANLLQVANNESSFIRKRGSRQNFWIKRLSGL